MRIDDQTLQDLCSGDPSTVSVFRASQAAFGLGGLARWWLDPAVLARAAQAPEAAPWCQYWKTMPALPRASGSCWVVLVKREEGQTLLREAFVLPLQWSAGRNHCDRLPRPLVDLADSVLQAVRKKGSRSYAPARRQRWGLHLPAIDGMDQLDLSGLTETLTWDSAWAPLAGGLIVAAHGGEPDPKVWATGAWTRGGLGISRVGGLQHKIELARNFGATRFFLPSDGSDSIVEGDHAGITVRKYDSSKSDVADALGEFLDALKAPPPVHASRKRKIRHHMQLRNNEDASRFFRSHCLGEIVKEQHEILKNQGIQMPAQLVTVATGNYELIVLAVLALRPEHVVVAFTDNTTKSYGAEAQDLLHAQGWNGSLEYCHFNRRKLSASLAGVTEMLPRANDPASRIFDLTPGFKEITIAFIFDIAQPGNRFMYVRHKYYRHIGRPAAFSQRIRIYDGFGYAHSHAGGHAPADAAPHHGGCG